MTKKPLVIVLLFVALPACGPEEIEAVGEKVNPLYVESSTVWPNIDIPVCWEQQNGLEPERGWVQDQIRQTWAAKSGVVFTGWGFCSGGSNALHIQFNTEGSWTDGFGTQLRGLVNGVNLNRYGSIADPQPCDRPSLNRQQCIRFISVFEFGHALGFLNEQNRDDTPAGCTAFDDGARGDIQVGPFDQNSVMFSDDSPGCNPKWLNGGDLSTGDVRGVRQFYGMPERDLDGDGFLDVLLHNPVSGQLMAWYTDGTMNVNSSNPDAGVYLLSPWKAVGSGDFNRDGRVDVLWHNPSTGVLKIWMMSNMTVNSTVTLATSLPESSGWKVVSTGDMDGDGTTDIVWFNADLGQLSFWLNGSGSNTRTPATVAPAGWLPFGTGDFNHDGLADVIWFNEASRQLSVWYLNENSALIASPVVADQPGPGWIPVTATAVNNDYHTDVIFVYPSTGEVSGWWFDGITKISSRSASYVVGADSYIIP